MVKTYQYRIYPTTQQRLTIEKQLDACQTLYNQALAMRKEAYDSTGETLTYNRQAALLTSLRKQSPFWANLHIDILQDTLRRLDKAFVAFFGRVKQGQKPGYPRFKGKGRYRCVTYSHLSSKLIRRTKGRHPRVVIPKLGQVKIRYHRRLPAGKIKTLTISRKASGWYAHITVQVADVPKVEIQSAVGVDVGLNHFLTTSDGDKINNPRYLRSEEKRLKQIQRVASKRKKGSNRRRKVVSQLAKQHEHVTNRRRDFHSKTAHWLYCRYDAVVVEDLRITNMVKNHHLAKSISDAAWGNFHKALASKAENAGLHLLKVPPHTTSQKCAGCGQTVKKSLSVRTHRCKLCHLVLDRDHNAAINIKRAASVLRGGALVANSPEKPPKRGKKRETRNSCKEIRLEFATMQAPSDSLNQVG